MFVLKLKGGNSIPQDGTKIEYRGKTYTRKGGGWVDSRGYAASNYLLEKLDSMKPEQYQSRSNQKSTASGSGPAVGRIGKAVTSTVSNVGKELMRGVKTAKANIAAKKVDRKPAAASAPRSNFSTPTPTYYTSLEKGITGYGLDPDLKKYLESLGVSDVSGLQTKLGGLTVDGKWGKRTQDAFTAGYNAWKQQQTERPQQQLFDYNQLFSQWDQWMNQLPRQQQGVTPMPATYDRYDIRHWLRDNNIKGITAGGRKALRHYLNGEDYDTRYLGIVDLYAPMIRGNLRGTQSTPTMDPEVVERFLSLIGTNINDLQNAYNNSRTNSNVDDMYAPGLWQGAIKNMTPTTRRPIDFMHKDQNGNITIDWGDPDRFNFSYKP